jgi:hypothetical protein
LMEHAACEGTEYFYAVKSAYGSAAAVSKAYRQQLLDHNFQIVDTPHVADRKNRADLLISVDAFERLHIGSPPIDRYIFVTGDSDFSVIMDRLRAYGKQVWLICPKADRTKRILARCCDRMLFIESFVPPQPAAAAAPAPPRPRPPSSANLDPAKHQLAKQLFQRVLRQIGPGGLPIGLPTVGMHMKNLHPGFDFRQSGFKRLTDLATHFEKAGLIRLGVTAKGMRQVEDMDDSWLEIDALPEKAAPRERAPAQAGLAAAAKTAKHREAKPKSPPNGHSSGEVERQILQLKDGRRGGKRQSTLGFAD